MSYTISLSGHTDSPDAETQVGDKVRDILSDLPGLTFATISGPQGTRNLLEESKNSELAGDGPVPSEDPEAGDFDGPTDEASEAPEIPGSHLPNPPLNPDDRPVG